MRVVEVDGVVARKDEKKWEKKRLFAVKRGDMVKSR